MSKQSLVILGRQPAVGLAELESMLGSDVIHPIGSDAALLDVPCRDVPFDRLGGSVKLAKLLHEFDSASWRAIETYLLENLPKHLKYTAEGKLTIGLSVFGLNVSPKQLLATGLSIKKVLRSHGKSVRLVPNKAPALNSAQVIHNKLFSQNGWELVLVRHGQRVLMGLTTSEQDIEAYTARDQARPKRDARVGMLPPKLAQIIINLAAATQESQLTILDPFCGTGVILQEAYLMGYGLYGSDISNEMVEYTNANLAWIAKGQEIPKTVLVADATSYTWEISSLQAVIATETYLGRPFSHEPDSATLAKVMQDCDTIHQKFLENVARQTESGFRLCIAVPAWHTKSGVKHLKTLDSLEKLGYNRVSFVHAVDRDLIYHREGQVVGRELVTLIRK